MRHPGTRSVLLLDPDNFTPYYVANLAHQLTLRGWTVEWLTSEHLFEPVQASPGVAQRNLFFRSLEGATTASKTPLRTRIWWLRRASKALSYPLDLLRLDKELGQRKPGILHVQWALLPRLDARFWKRWQCTGWKIVYTAHDVEPRAGTGSRLSGSTRTLLTHADAVVVHSKLDQAAVSNGQVPSERVWRIAEGGPGLFWQPEPRKQDARRDLGLEADRPIVLFFGMIKAYKGIGVLLRSIELVQEQVPNSLLLIAGQIPGRERHWLQDIQQAEARGCTVWHRGYVPLDRVQKYFAAADVVTLPYLTSSSSGVIPQAYAAGRPVVASSVGGLPEMVEHDHTGLLVPPGDVQALARSLTSLLSDPARVQRMGTAAKQQASRYSWDRASADTERLYLSL